MKNVKTSLLLFVLVNVGATFPFDHLILAGQVTLYGVPLYVKINTKPDTAPAVAGVFVIFIVVMLLSTVTEKKEPVERSIAKVFADIAGEVPVSVYVFRLVEPVIITFPVALIFPENVTSLAGEALVLIQAVWLLLYVYSIPLTVVV